MQCACIVLCGGVCYTGAVEDSNSMWREACTLQREVQTSLRQTNFGAFCRKTNRETGLYFILYRIEACLWYVTQFNSVGHGRETAEIGCNTLTSALRYAEVNQIAIWFSKDRRTKFIIVCPTQSNSAELSPTPQIPMWLQLIDYLRLRELRMRSERCPTVRYKCFAYFSLMHTTYGWITGLSRTFLKNFCWACLHVCGAPLTSQNI